MNYKRMIIILSLGLGFAFCFFFKELNRYEQFVYMNWGIDLPNASKERYGITEAETAHKDGNQYHVFLYKSDKRLVALDWQFQKNGQLEQRMIEILAGLEVEKQLPSFDQDYLSIAKDDDEG